MEAETQSLVRMKLSIFVLALVFSLVPASGLWAQSPPETGVDVLDRERAAEPPRPRSLPRMRIGDDGAPAGEAPDVEVLLRSLSVDGATVFTEEELLAPYKGLYGQSVSFAMINGIVLELTKKYRDSGYILSQVLLPPQDVDQAAADIRLAAIEGFIASVEYEGDRKLAEALKGRAASAEARLTSQRPLNHRQFEREMLLMQDLPGLKVSSYFKKSNVPGGTVLVLKVERGHYVSGSLGWGDYGTGSAGPGMWTGSLSLDSWPLAGLKSSISYLQANNRNEYWSLGFTASYMAASGLSVSGSASFSDSPEPDTVFASLFDYKTKSRTLAVNASYPVIRTRDLNLSFGAGFEHRDSSSDILGGRYKEDRLRTLSFNADVDFSDELGGVTQLIATYSVGLDAFGATDRSPLASNELAPANFNKIDLFAYRDQRLPAGFSVLLTAQAGFSDRILASYHKFSFGGQRFGRGYESGALEGDNTLAFSLEPRWTRYLTERLALQPFAFYDSGSVWSHAMDELAPRRESGASWGGGLRVWGHAGPSYFPDFRVALMIGEPIHKTSEEDGTRCVLTADLYF
jgi:hemolysin activation/secretion protein